LESQSGSSSNEDPDEPISNIGRLASLRILRRHTLPMLLMRRGQMELAIGPQKIFGTDRMPPRDDNAADYKRKIIRSCLN